MNRAVNLRTLLGEQLRLLSVQGVEELSSLFELRIVAVSSSDRLECQQFLGSEAALEIQTSGPTRYIHGVISQARALGRQTSTEAYYAYELILRPQLWYLSQAKDSRIFQNQTTVDILKQVFAPYNLEVDYQLTQSYREWGYCVQYDETDFNFVSRLMEHEGIYYYFKHEQDKHTLVLVDDMAVHQPLPCTPELGFYPPDRVAVAQEEYISEWQTGGEITPTAYTTRDYDFEKPRAEISAYQLHEKQGIEDLEIYKPFGGYTTDDEAQFYARVHLQAMQWPQYQGFGLSNARSITPGYTFNLQHYPVDAENQPYLIIRAEYDIRVQAYVTEQHKETRFITRFRAIPVSSIYRAPRLTPQPKAQGPLTATVVGPEGEEIWTDRYGRIKVQFHWDRDGQSDEYSSCWVRVSSPWSGGGFGGVQIPRVKEEVVVDFINGQLDRPIVVGRVYNALNMPPVKLPEDATQSGFFTRTKGSDPNNANRLMFEDMPGKELLSMVANRDMDTHVKNDQTTDVVGNVNDTIAGNRLHTAHSTSAITLESGGERHYGADHQRIIQTSLDETIQSNNQETFQDGVDEHITGSLTSVVQGQASQHLHEDHKNTTTQDDETVTGVVQEQIQQGDYLNVAGQSSLNAGGNIDMKTPSLVVTATDGQIETHSGGTVDLGAASDITIEGGSQMTSEAPTSQEMSLMNDVNCQVANRQSSSSIKITAFEDTMYGNMQSTTGMDIGLTGISSSLQAIGYAITGAKITIDEKNDGSGNTELSLAALSVEVGKQDWKAGAGGGGAKGKAKKRKKKGKDSKKKARKQQKKSRKQNAKKKKKNKKRSRCKPCNKRGVRSVGFVLGEEILEHHDFSLPGAMPIIWDRLYRSNFPEYDERGLLGARWVNNYLVSIEEDIDGDLLYLNNDGVDCHSDALEIGESWYDNDEEIYWSRESDSHLNIRNKDFVQWSFERINERSSLYRLYQIHDRHGNKIELKYNLLGHLSLLSNNLFDLFFEHDEQGRISRIWHYVAASETAPKTERTLAQYEYDAAGDLVQSLDEYQGKNTYRYEHHLLTYYSDKTGRGTHLAWDGTHSDARCIREAADDGMFAIQLAWDDEAQICKVTDGLGLSTHYHYNDDNYNIAEYYPDGSRILIERDEFNNVIKTTFNDGSTREFEYDEFDNTIREVRQDGGVTLYEYDEYHQVTKVIEPGGQVWLNRYDAQGNQIEQQDPLGHITRYTYNTQGEISQIIDAKGGTKRILYNHMGLMEKYIDCSSKVTQWRYDDRYRVTEVINALGQTTQYSYDTHGFMIKRLVEGLEAEYFHHDAEGRLLRYTDGLNQSTQYAYGASGLLEERRNPLGHSVAYRYDPVGRLKVLTNENHEQYRFIYDPVGRLVETSAFDDKVRRNYFDKTTGHLVKSEFEGQATHYHFDVMGNLCERRAGEQRESFSYDINLNLVVARNAHSEYVMRYDPLGNLLEQHQRLSLFNQERHYTWQYQYDELSNPIQTIRPDGRVVDYLRYGSGHLHGILLDKETVADFERDQLHREVKRSLAEQIHQKSIYDTGGRLSEQQLKLGRYGQRKLQERHYQYDQANRLVGIEDSRLGKTSYRYDAIDRLIQANNPHSQETFTFDPAHNLIAKSSEVTGTYGMGSHASQELANTLPAGVSKVMGNLLKSIAGIHFRYDAQGNLIEKTKLHSQQQFEWDGFNQLSQIHTKHLRNSEHSQVNYYYDALGLRIAKEVKHSSSLQSQRTVFSWDGMVLGIEEQLSELTESEQLTNEHANGLADASSRLTAPPQGQACSAILKATHYLYEESQSYQAIAQYDYRLQRSSLGFEVLRGATHYYLNDHLGTPQALLNEQQEFVWQAQAKAWGETRELIGVGADADSMAGHSAVGKSAERQYDVGQERVETPLRFQGQYEDRESELHYNTFRYYDPEIGRFISQDPIGLLGGINLYQYAPNPVEWVDPWGLAKLFEVGTYGSLNTGQHIGDGLQAHELIRHEALVQSGLASKKNRLSNNPSIALDLDHHTRGPLKDSRGIGGVHYHESRIRRQLGLGPNEFHPNIKVEMDITQGALRKAGVPKSIIKKLRKDAEKFYSRLQKQSICEK